MNLNEMKQALAKLQRELQAYNHALACLQTDGETAAPEAASKARGETMAFFSQKSYELLVSQETRDLLSDLWACRDELDALTRRQVELLRKQQADMTCIPMEEVVAYSILCNDSIAAWLQAKANNDYASFEPYLAKMIETKRRFAAYQDPDRPAYNVLLDDYEKGMTMETLDEFFGMLRKELVPLIDSVRSLPARPAFVNAECSIERQREFSSYLMDAICIDRKRCTLTETEHPFTCGMNRSDVRITTHYYPTAVLSSMYSVIHEGGHAQYELGIAEEYQNTALSGTPSMGMHESQSRFYENLIGHDAAFLATLLPKMRELFPEAMEGVTERDLFFAANYVEPSLIRIEADQVTYPLHIMVRYELEKQLIGGTLSTKDLPEAWNRLYKEYLGVDVPNDTLGVLQDTHWASGLLGYFPTYALGSAYASQFLAAMKKELDVDAQLAKGDVAPITEWLGEHIHRWGNLYTPAELIRSATGEDFDPSYYVAHLKKVIADLLA